jgi:hypothetical protein
VANVKTVNASNSKKYLQYIPMPVLKIAWHYEIFSV